MTDSCSCPNEAENDVCELPMRGKVQHLTHLVYTCPHCGRKGKPVQTQTVKAMLSVSLREVKDTTFLFCTTKACSVVYFSSNREQTFTVNQIREKVYQKKPDSEKVFICYCFRHTVGEIRTVPSKSRITIADDIIQGIRAGQCACDLLNPQGSCCLGNVNKLIKQIEKSVPPVIPGN